MICLTSEWRLGKNNFFLSRNSRVETGVVRSLSVPDKETGETDVRSKVPTGYPQ